LWATDGERERRIPDPDGWPAYWPWRRWRWRFAVRAAVGTFPPGQPFTMLDLQRRFPQNLMYLPEREVLIGELERLWREGVVIVVGGRWAVPSHPDFSPQEWQAFLRRAWRERGRAPGLDRQEELNVAYHVHLWEKRIRTAGTVEALEAVGRLIQEREPNPEVRERLRPVYRERLRNQGVKAASAIADWRDVRLGLR